MVSKLLLKRQKIKEKLDYWKASEFATVDETFPVKEILESSAVKIHNKIISGEWSCEMVMRVMCYGALQAHIQTNCLTEIMFDRALNKAQEMDKDFARTGKPRGKLHGVPLSVKDHVHVKGVDSTGGYSKFALNPTLDDAALVKILEAQGAIVFCKTNVPQTMMTFECSNPIFGRTVNPLNKNLSPGGSSGGESALIAAGGSCLGMGSDGAGSLRIPAAFCGLYALKPSFGRFSLEGNGNEGLYLEFVLPTLSLGPIARNIEDLELFMEAATMVQLDSYDLSVKYKRDFQPYQFKQTRLKIGYYTHCGFIESTPACARAVIECVEALKQEGHELVKFDVPDSFEGCKIFFALSGPDCLQGMVNAIGSDPREKHISSTFNAYLLPRWFKRFVSFVLRIMGEPQASELISVVRGSTVYEYWGWMHKKNLFIKQFMEYWKSTGVDFVIAPGFGCPPAPHDSFGDTSVFGWYTAMYNLLDFSVGAVPVTEVDKNIDIICPEKLKKLNILEKKCFDYYDPVACHGMPLGVQVIGGHQEDEKTLAAMKIVDECVKKNFKKKNSQF